MPGKWEQLWAEKIEGDHFRLCCVPFFAYGLALGDVVATSSTVDSPFVVSSVVAESGHTTVRVALTKPEDSESLAQQLVDAAKTAGFIFEWYTATYLAIDSAPGSSELQGLVDVLDSLSNVGLVEYEFSK